MSSKIFKIILKLFIMIRLKELREEYALTQTQLAKELGFTQNIISKWEKGRIEPNIQTLVILSNYFHVTIDYLIGKDQAVLTEENSVETITDEEKELLKEFKDLSQTQKYQVTGYIQGLKSISSNNKIQA